MRRLLHILFGALCLMEAGCTLVGDATHLLAYKTAECVRDSRERKRNAAWAEQAWWQVASKGGPYSADYAAGFQEGFACYLYRGGNGEPPVLPPKHYRELKYQTPQGYAAIEQWFAGYRHGATVAKEGGYRELITGPTALKAGLSPSPPPPPPGFDVDIVQEPPPAVPRPRLGFDDSDDGSRPIARPVRPARPEILPAPREETPKKLPETPH